MPTFSRAVLADANMAAVQVVVVGTDCLRYGSKGENVLFHTVSVTCSSQSFHSWNVCFDWSLYSIQFWFLRAVRASTLLVCHDLHFDHVVEQGPFPQVQSVYLFIYFYLLLSCTLSGKFALFLLKGSTSLKCIATIFLQVCIRVFPDHRLFFE